MRKADKYAESHVRRKTCNEWMNWNRCDVCSNQRSVARSINSISLLRWQLFEQRIFRYPSSSPPSWISNSHGLTWMNLNVTVSFKQTNEFACKFETTATSQSINTNINSHFLRGPNRQFCTALTVSVYKKKINMYKIQTTNESSENKTNERTEKRKKSEIRNVSTQPISRAAYSMQSVSALCVHRVLSDCRELIAVRNHRHSRVLLRQLCARSLPYYSSRSRCHCHADGDCQLGARSYRCTVIGHPILLSQKCTMGEWIFISGKTRYDTTKIFEKRSVTQSHSFRTVRLSIFTVSRYQAPFTKKQIPFFSRTYFLKRKRVSLAVHVWGDWFVAIKVIVCAFKNSCRTRDFPAFRCVHSIRPEHAHAAAATCCWAGKRK